MNKKISILSITLTIILLQSCFSDMEDTTEIIITPEVPTIIESSSVVINVKDPFGKEIKGLTAKFDNQVKIVNQFSYFHFSASDINKFNELLTITDVNGKSYEFSLHNIENQVNYHDITIYQNPGSLTYPHDSEINIPFDSDKFGLQISANSYTLSNTKYSGLVNCQYQAFDCSIETEKNALPGTETVTINGKRMFFEQMDALQIQFYTADNKNLELSGTQIVKYNKSTSDQLEVVKYDNIRHMWEYVGKLNTDNSFEIYKSGTYAIGKIRELAIVSGKWQVEDRALVKEKLSFQFEERTFYTYTNNEGGWEILCPLNTQVTITAVDDCIIGGEKISIQTNATEIKTGLKQFQNTQVKHTQVIGKFSDCNYNDQIGGFLFINTNGQKEQIYIPAHEINLMLTCCTQEASSIGFVSNKNLVSWEYAFDKGSLDLGRIFDCNEIQQNYINLKTAASSKLIMDFSSITDQNGILTINHENTGSNFMLKIKHLETSSIIDPSLANIVWIDSGYNNAGIEISCPFSSTCGFENVQITAYKKNEYIRGYFKGNFWAKRFTPLSADYQNIEGHFHINL